MSPDTRELQLIDYWLTFVVPSFYSIVSCDIASEMSWMQSFGGVSVRQNAEDEASWSNSNEDTKFREGRGEEEEEGEKRLGL